MRCRNLATVLVLPLVAALLAPHPGWAENADRVKWDQRYSEAGYRYGDDPAPTLKRWQALLRPVRAAAAGQVPRALDLACGEAQNGVYLARLGYAVDAVDISEVALGKARRLAQRHGVAGRLTTVQADLERHRLAPGRYDVIVNFRFFLRRLAPQIVAALRPGGVLVFESFTVDDEVAARPGAAASHFLRRNELLRLFGRLKVIYYHERRHQGRAKATLVARKPGAGDWLRHSDPGGDVAKQ